MEKELIDENSHQGFCAFQGKMLNLDQEPIKTGLKYYKNRKALSLLLSSVPVEWGGKCETKFVGKVI